VTAVPWIFLIDKNGIVRRQFIGVPDEKRLSDAIETLMGEHEAAK
jgi:hypothetical protein